MKQFIAKTEEKKRLSLDDFKKQKADLNKVFGAFGSDDCCRSSEPTPPPLDDCHPSAN